jgi:hypothetical protein
VTHGGPPGFGVTCAAVRVLWPTRRARLFLCTLASARMLGWVHHSLLYFLDNPFGAPGATISVITARWLPGPSRWTVACAWFTHARRQLHLVLHKLQFIKHRLPSLHATLWYPRSRGLFCACLRVCMLLLCDVPAGRATARTALASLLTGA